ncbi:MAG TPA: orotidine-5'-phosphate decarboxylase [Planctomycetes bacterium]|nr:orotidine-5'-phosphate decarboxylase [Planctomycetota bacterium]
MTRGTFSERLRRAVETHGPLCVGIDPTVEALPEELREKAGTAAEQAAAIGIFADAVTEAVEGIAGVVKFQVGFFERYGAAGYVALETAVKKAKHAGFIVIADCKRGDIGSTMKAYARYYMDVLDVDAVTLNPYMGRDVIEPFIPYVSRGKGAFLLVRTSNAAAAEVQEVSASEGHPYHLYLTGRIAAWQDGLARDEAGYLPMGVVAGATAPEDIRRIRSRHPELLMLVPGFGFQGGTADDVAGAFDAEGNGAVVNSSRAVIYAFGDAGAGKDWRASISEAARSAQAVLRNTAANAG